MAHQQHPIRYGGGDAKLRTVGYFVNWAIYGRGFNPQDLDATHFTHILYSFANVRPDSGEVYLSDAWSDTDKHYADDSWNDPGTNLYGCLKQFYKLKKQNRNLKVLLSIGGWTYSSNFPGGAASDANRQKFVDSAMAIVRDCGFDGLDIDWEYPDNPTDAQNYVTLLQMCRKALDGYGGKYGGHMYLTVAAPCGPQHIKNMNIKGMDEQLDFWNLMAYDFAGSWDKNAGHQANINKSNDNPDSTPFNLVEALNMYRAGGVDNSKMVIGMPLYGRAFKDTEGPGKPFSGVGEGSWENGVWDFKALPRPGAQEFQDNNILASWCYDGSQRTMVSYDTQENAQKKAQWIVENGLGGAMWWETSGDKKGAESLVKGVVDVFGGANSDRFEKVHNNLEYPESKYENLRKRME